jgi:hypothetical protein
MTWQGGKKREEPVGSPFARLAPLVPRDKAPDLGGSLGELATALKGAKSAVKLHLRFVTGGETAEVVEHWEVAGGKARRQKPGKADVVVVMRPETWMQIARGELAPYDALLAGKLRVGGDLEAAKELVRHLTDPSASYMPPC